MNTKKITIVSKRKSDIMLLDSLFNPVNGKTLTRTRYDLGKYKPSKFIGREIECNEHVQAIFTQSQRDSNGPYVALYCLVSR
jgi:hypothetical protein